MYVAYKVIKYCIKGAGIPIICTWIQFNFSIDVFMVLTGLQGFFGGLVGCLEEQNRSRGEWKQTEKKGAEQNRGVG